MEPDKLNASTIWLITVRSKWSLSNENRDFITELISEEARKAIESCRFILHNIVESERYSKILIEGTKTALTNLISVIKDNLPFRITYGRRML
jgi:hypothetical protein